MDPCLIRPFLLHFLFYLRNCQRCLNIFPFSRSTNYMHNFQVLLRFIYQFCNTIEWSGSGDCLLLSDVITQASDLLCRISFRVARRLGTSPGEYLSWLVSSLVCRCCRAQDCTHRRCWTSYFALLLYYSCTWITSTVALWRGCPLSFPELVGCLDEQSIYFVVTYFSCTTDWPTHQMVALHLTVDFKIRLNTLNWKWCKIPCDILS